MNNYGLGILIQAKDEASATFQKVERNFDSLSKKSDELASRMKASTKTFFAGVGMMGAGVAALAIPVGFAKSTFETQKALGELASLGIEDLESIEKAARGFSNEFAGTTTAQFIAAAYDIKSGIASLTDAAVGEYTQLAALTGKATKASTEQMTSLFATAYGIYKDFYSDMSDFEFGEVFSGGLSQAVRQFKTTGPEMQASIERLGAIATSALVPMEEQLSVLGMLQATMSGSEAGTKYQAFLKSIARAGNELSISVMDANNQLLPMPVILDKFKERYGETLDAVEKQEIQKAFGRFEAVAFLDLFYGKSDLVRENVNALGDAMKNGTSVTNEMARAMNQDMGAQLEILAQQWQNLKETLGATILPLLNPVLERVGGIIKKFQEWADNNKPLAKTIFRIALAAGAFLFVGGAILALLGALGMMSVGLASLPMAAGALAGVAAAIWPVLTAVAAFVAIGYLLYKAWTTNFLGVRDIVLSILQKLQSGFSSFMKAHGDTLSAFARMVGKVVFAVLAVAGAVRVVRAVVLGATTAWRAGAMAIRFLYLGFHLARAYAEYYARAMLAAAKNTLAFAKTAAAQATQAVRRFALSLAAAAKRAVVFSVALVRNAVAAVAAFAVSLATSAVAAIGAFAAALVPAIAGAWAFAVALLANPLTWIVLAIIALVVAIVLLVKNWDKVKEVAQRVWGAVVDWTKGAVERIRTYFTGVYQAVVDAFSRAWEWLKGFIGKWWPYILGAFTGGLGLLVGLVIQNRERIMAIIRSAGAAIVGLITGAVNAIRMRWEALKAAVAFIWQSIQQAAAWAVNSIQNVVSGVITTIQFRWQQYRSAVAAVWNSISATISGVIAGIQSRVQAVISFITALWNGLKSAVSGVWNSIVEKIGGAVATIKNKLMGLVPDWLRTALGRIGINIPAPTTGGDSYAAGAYVAKTGGVTATLHEGEVITPAPAVQKIVRFADMIPASGVIQSSQGGSAAGPVSNHISISLPNVREIDRQSIEELANLIIRKIEYMQKRKREAGFSNDFNPSMATVARI
jgi:TP901 family phage tail tape measure protein